ncbi:Probable phospholipase A1 magnifin [Eumeta japonica]|uniref:Probable phospholipase A1 magnifin n=1 Tax=Eumeta variegata TaxID=151549 RepID=A0A4C1YV89_EUMVA|nr:Probable phospholipase A1 magnifin [Eumeta japonica]
MLTRVLLLLFLVRSAVSGSLYDLVINAVTCGCNRSTDLDVSKVKLYTYDFMTNKNASCFLNQTDEAILANPNFNSEQCVHIFIPGFRNNISSTPPNEVRCALANYTCNSKKIVLGIIDHSAYLSGNSVEDLDYVGLYEKAVLGKDKVMVSGHSLGGQMAGQAAEYSKNLGYSLSKLLAIDPAGPCFKDCLSQHVKSGQADTVMAIHCNAGELGSNLNLTDYDAYSGNGVTQIGCKGGNASDLIIKDSNIWQAKECASYTAYSNGACDSNSKMLVNYNVTTNNTEDRIKVIECLEDHDSRRLTTIMEHLVSS